MKQIIMAALCAVAMTVAHASQSDELSATERAQDQAFAQGVLPLLNNEELLFFKAQTLFTRLETEQVMPTSQVEQYRKQFDDGWINFSNLLNRHRRADRATISSNIDAFWKNYSDQQSSTEQLKNMLAVFELRD